MSSNQLKQNNSGGNLLIEYAAENLNLHNKSPSNDFKDTENQQLRQSSNVQQYEAHHQVYTGSSEAAYAVFL